MKQCFTLETIGLSTYSNTFKNPSYSTDDFTIFLLVSFLAVQTCDQSNYGAITVIQFLYESPWSGDKMP